MNERKRTQRLSMLGAIVMLAANSSFAQDPTIDRLLASQCAQCHGTDGYAVGGMEKLAGEDAIDLNDDLIDMKMEDRPEDIMDHQALGYSNEQIWRIARYFASLPEE